MIHRDYPGKTVCEQRSGDNGSGQAQEALRRDVDVVLACGGDGTVRTVAEVLAGTGMPMALIPAGTGNLLARTIGTPLDGIFSATRVALVVSLGFSRLEKIKHRFAFGHINGRLTRFVLLMNIRPTANQQPNRFKVASTSSYH